MTMRTPLSRRSMLLLTAAVAVVDGPASAVPALSIRVYKDPQCGCCTAWVDRLRSAGFTATVEERGDLEELKTSLGVPDDLTSCHTGVIAGYAIEGHVPPADIKRLVAARPVAKGLAVPGMPINSPGMEIAGAPDEPYTVWLFMADGTRTAFARHGA